MKLLTPAHANTKTAKNKQFKRYLSFILHLAPSNLSGVMNTCPKASKGCRLACLNTAGRGQFTSVQVARIRKTVMLKAQPDVFKMLLIKDLDAVVRKAKKLRKQAVVRLNGTSDLDWTSVLGFNVFKAYPTIQFYDYTKVLSRLDIQEPNYHLTFSRSESNVLDWTQALNRGINVAIVYDQLPAKQGLADVISGDDHDLRFLDPSGPSGGTVLGRVIGLTAKGNAKRDQSGFVIRTKT